MTDYPVDLLEDIGWAIASNMPTGSHEQARAVLVVLEAYIAARESAARQAALSDVKVRWHQSRLRVVEVAQ